MVTQKFDARLTTSDKGYIISRILYDDIGRWNNSASDIVGEGFWYTNAHYLKDNTSIVWTNERALHDFIFIKIRFETFNPWSAVEPIEWLGINNYHATYEVFNYTVTVTFIK